MRVCAVCLTRVYCLCACVFTVQLILDGKNTGIGGTFTLSFRGYTTSPITVALANNSAPCDAVSANVVTALDALQSIGTVAVTAYPIVSFNVTFGCRLLITFLTNTGDLPLLLVNSSSSASLYSAQNSNSTGGTLTPSAAVATVLPVRDGTSTGLGGTFTVAFNGQVTGYLKYDTTADEMKSALESLTTIETVAVTRSGVDVNNGYTWSVTFQTELGPQSYMTMDVLAMTGTMPKGYVNKAVVGVSPPFTSGPGGLALGSAIITDMDNLEYTITGLRQGVIYSVRVSAANAVGYGVPLIASPKFIAPMPQPPTQPLQFTATVVDSSDVALAWNEPERGGGADILDYLVEWDTAPLVAEVQEVDVIAPVRNEVQVVTTTAAFVGEVQYLAVRSNASSTTLVSEVQTVACDATGGSFTLTLAGYTTGAIAWNASRNAVLTAIVSLPNVQNVTVTFNVNQTTACAPYTGGYAPWPMTFVFDAINGLAGYHGNVPQIAADATQLQGHRVITVATLVDGSSPVNSGFFTVAFDDSYPANVSYPATAAQLRASLESLPTIGTGNINVSVVAIDAVGNTVYKIVFRFGGNVQAIFADPNNNFLLGNGAAVSVCADDTANAAVACVAAGSTWTPVAGNQLSGTYTLTLNGHTTAPVSFDVTDTQLKVALEALPNLGTVVVHRTGPDAQLGYSWTVTFLSNPGMFPIGSGDLAPLVPDGTYLFANTSSVVVTTATNGSDPVRGNFTLSFRNSAVVTGPMRFDADAADVVAALQTLPPIGRVEVSRTVLPTVGYRWLVTFSGCRVVYGADVCVRGNEPLLVANTSQLLGGYSGSQSYVAVSEVVPGSGNSTSSFYGSYDYTDLSQGQPYTYTAKGLTPGLQYYFRVAARNSQSYGSRAYSLPEFVIPYYQVPIAPLPPVLVATSATSIQLQWEHPEETGGLPVTGYQLEMDTWQVSAGEGA